MLKRVFPLMILALIAAMVMTGCGSNSSQPMTSATTTSNPSSIPAVINFGDDPSDSVLSLEVTIQSIVLTNRGGQQVSVLSSPTRIEVTRLAGTFAPLAHVSIPAGTYTGAVVTIANPEITFVNSAGKTVELSPQLSNPAIQVSFSPALVVGGGASAFNFDFDVSKSVTFDAAGVPSLNGVITVVPVAASAAGGINPEHGDIDDVKGVISATTSSTFTITVHDGAQSLTFAIDTSTQFSGVNGIADLKTGMQVEVAAISQADGSLLAKKVEVQTELEGMDATGANLEGLVTATTGTPTTQVSILVRDIESSMGSAPTLGATVTTQVTGNTKFAVSSMNFTMPTLPFTPAFDASTIAKGQNVEIETDLSSSSPVASKIKLAKQALHGTASATTASGSLTTFTLTLPADSAFAALTGASTVTVYETSSTELKGLTSVTDGSSVRVRGLLFFDGTGYRLVATAIAKV